MSALLLVGSDASIRIDDHRTRSRRFFQRGLFLSGVIHLSLLFVFLSLTNRDEGVVRVYQTPIDVFRQPPSLLPRIQPPSTGSPRFQPVNRGVFEPKRDVIDLPVPNPGVTPFASPKLQPGLPTDGGGPENPAPPAASTGPYPIDKVDEPPVAIYAPKPVYPEIAREMVLTGRVLLKVLVGEDGNVRKVEVVSGPRLLAESAQETLYRWRFRPARFQGRPVSVWLEVPVNFVM